MQLRLRRGHATFSSFGYLWSVIMLVSMVVMGKFLLVESAPLRNRTSALHWLPATATWYGSPEGDGSDGGACGYGSLVDVKPFSPVLFKNGEGCGACYKVRCMDRTICSKRAVTIIVTDECPGGYCANGRTHFDLSGAAFGRMAVAGAHNRLRDRGELSVIYRRTPCLYRGKNIAFHVNEGSTDHWLSLLVEFEDGDGDIGSMQIKQVEVRELHKRSKQTTQVKGVRERKKECLMAGIKNHTKSTCCLRCKSLQPLTKLDFLWCFEFLVSVEGFLLYFYV